MKVKDKKLYNYLEKLKFKPTPDEYSKGWNDSINTIRSIIRKVEYENLNRRRI